MSDVQPDPLRERFQSSARERFTEITALLDRLDSDPADHESAARLMRHFHYFAGLGATCGFPRVSAIGDEGEASIRDCVGEARPIAPDAVRRWRELLAEVLTEVSR